MADCEHPIQAGGMCAICGIALTDTHTTDSMSLIHDTQAIKVSKLEAQRLDSESTKRLLEHRKLALIVDLDQTIIHATVDPTVGEWLRDPSNPNYDALQGVGSFRLGMDGKAILEDGSGKNGAGSSSSSPSANDSEGCWYYVKPRPGLKDFLHSLAERYELHVYTMGTRSYADCVCKLVDPDGSLFGTRILSRDENGSLVQKSLSRLFPMDTSMVVIIDDRGDVWQWSPNLIKVIPYDFFLGSGDINAGFLPAQTGPGAPANPGSDASASPSQSSPSQQSSPPSPSPAASSSDQSAASAASQSSQEERPTPSSGPSSPGSDVSAEGSSLEHKSTTEKLNDAAERQEARAVERDVKAKAEQSQKEIVTEQLGSRPLARMQEQLDEKLGVSPSGTSTPIEVESASDGESSNSVGGGAAASVSHDSVGAAAPGEKPTSTSPTSQEAAKPNPNEAPSPSAAMPPRPQALLKDTDKELVRIQNILDEIHSQWFTRWDTMVADRAATVGAGGAVSDSPPEKPNVTEIISELKAKVFRNCELVFSSLVPLGGELEDSEYFWMAMEFGATCAKDLKAETTHVVAAKNGTAKVNAAHHRKNVNVVWPSWLHDSIARWAKQPEEPYRLPPVAPAPNGEDVVLSSAHPTDDEISSEDFDLIDESTAESTDAERNAASTSNGGMREPLSRSVSNAAARGGQSWTGLDGVDWAEADKELEEYLNGSDSEGDEGEYDQDAGKGAFADDEDEGTNTDYSQSATGTPSRRGKAVGGKRSRRSTPSANGDATSLNNDNDTGTGTPVRLIEDKGTTSSGKRRRVVIGATQQADGTFRTTGDVSAHLLPERDADGHHSSRSGSVPRSSASSTGGDGDETRALMKDLEDELEAALDGSEGDTDGDGDGDGDAEAQGQRGADAGRSDAEMGASAAQQ